MDDVAVTTELDAGQRRGIAALYEQHAPHVLRLAYLMTGDRHLAEDLVHDAFARVIGRLGHLRERGMFDSYLRRAVVNLAKNHYRRRDVERAYASRFGAADTTTQPDIAAVDAMRRALMKLPNRQRAAVALRYYEDYSDEQIGATLDCKPGTVRSLLSRALVQLRADLKEDNDE
ncbi:MAG: RNA polymerase sigma factor [Actinomycetota bacterium]